MTESEKILLMVEELLLVADDMRQYLVRKILKEALLEDKLKGGSLLESEEAAILAFERMPTSPTKH